MNIFFLFTCPHASARAQCDKHVVKMTLEGTQMMYTAHHMCGDVEAWDASALKIYKATHVNHPTVRWVRAAAAHYLWLHAHVWALLDEYMLRYGRAHECARHLGRLRTPPTRIPELPDPTTLTMLPRLSVVNAPDGCIGAPACIEEEARSECLAYSHDHIDLVESYRRYYEWKRRNRKVDMHWKRRQYRRRWRRAAHWICLMLWLLRCAGRRRMHTMPLHDSKRRRL